MSERVWKQVIEGLHLDGHNFDSKPYYVDHSRIKKLVSRIDVPTNQKEIRVLGYQTQRDDKPEYFRKNNLFLLPASNKSWVISKGDGYFDIPVIDDKPADPRRLPFPLLSLQVGSSEQQYIDYAYASGIISHFTGQQKLFLTTRGRKRMDPLEFKAYGFPIRMQGSVQTEVDAGYESSEELILIEAKSFNPKTQSIRQLFFPYRKWSTHVEEKGKKVRNVLFIASPQERTICMHEYVFKDDNTYESIKLVKSGKYGARLAE